MSYAAQMSELEHEMLQQMQSIRCESANAAARERIADADIIAAYRIDPAIGARTASYQARIRAAYQNGVERGYGCGMSL